jgi:hypothetical protein
MRQQFLPPVITSLSRTLRIMWFPSLRERVRGYKQFFSSPPEDLRVLLAALEKMRDSSYNASDR